MMRIGVFVLLISSIDSFYVRNQTGTPERPLAAELRSKKESIELFGRQIDVPDWMNAAADKTRGLFDSASDLLGKGRSSSSGARKSTSDDLMTGLKQDETTRIWFAVYLNILALVLIYVFITIKLALLSLSEGQEERRKRHSFSSHVAFDSPDYNLPLASIATRGRAPMSLDNPTADDFEMAREAVEPLDYDAVPSTERDEQSF